MSRSILISICACALSNLPSAAQKPTAGVSQPVTPVVGIPIVWDAIFGLGVNCSGTVQVLFDGGLEVTVRADEGDNCDLAAVLLNLELGAHGLSVPAMGRLRAATTGRPSTSVFGSEAAASFTLTSGEQMNAWISDSILNTALLPTNSSLSQTLKAAGQYTLSGQNPQNVIAGDFNGDGNTDLAVSNFGNLDTNAGGNITILLGKGDGTFTTGATANAGVTPVSMYAADFNGDGKLDLAAANLTVGSISVMLGNGDGTFQAPWHMPLTNSHSRS
jgi:FG-GAP-like repeat